MPDVVGVIFAGGYGKRLRPYTLKVPKPLIEIKPGYTILDKQLFDLSSSGVREVYLLVGYLHEKIMERYGDRHLGMKINYLVEEKPMGTHWALGNALNYIDRDMVVMNGDVVTDISIRGLIEEGSRSGNLITVTVVKMRSPYGILELAGRKVVAFREKPVLNHYINAGLYFIRNGVKSYFERRYVHKDIEKTVFREVARDGLMGAYMEEGAFWRSIDSLKDLEAVREAYRGRVDRPWGYEKELFRRRRRRIYEVYIRRGEVAELSGEFNEVIVVLDGEGALEVDGRLEILSAGKVVNIGRGSPRRITALENMKMHRYVVV